MSDKVYIKDDFGNAIPLLDDHGLLSLQVIMLYSEDKLSEVDRKVVSNYAASDEMANDALEGYAQSSNPVKTRIVLGQLNSSIQKKSGAKALSPVLKSTDEFDYRRIAAAIALLVAVGSATFLIANKLSKDELADGSKPKVQDTSNEQTVVKQKADYNINESELSDSVEELLSKQPVLNEALRNEVPVKNIALEIPKGSSEETERSINSEKSQPPRIAESSGGSPEPQKEVKSTKDLDLVSESDDFEIAEPQEEAEIQLAASTISDEAKNRQLAENEQMKREDVSEAKQKASRVSADAGNASSEAAVAEFDYGSAGNVESEKARFPGGDIAMYKFIERKKNYTDAMRAQNVKGTVTVSFKIAEDGRVTDAKIQKGVTGVLDEDALRIVRSMPKWQAAKENGLLTETSKTVVIKYGE